VPDYTWRVAVAATQRDISALYPVAFARCMHTQRSGVAPLNLAADVRSRRTGSPRSWMAATRARMVAQQRLRPFTAS